MKHTETFSERAPVVQPNAKHQDVTPESKRLGHLKAVDARILEVEKAIRDQMYVDDVAFGLEMATKMRHEAHVKNLEDERAELGFLKARRLMLEVIGGR